MTERLKAPEGWWAHPERQLPYIGNNDGDVGLAHQNITVTVYSDFQDYHWPLSREEAAFLSKVFAHFAETGELPEVE